VWLQKIVALFLMGFNFISTAPVLLIFSIRLEFKNGKICCDNNFSSAFLPSHVIKPCESF